MEGDVSEPAAREAYKKLADYLDLFPKEEAFVVGFLKGMGHQLDLDIIKLNSRLNASEKKSP